MPLISIIIPCYNAGKYVDRCLETLKNQTIGFENLEIILINDASTDNTLEKLKGWEERYPEQIMLISLEENMRQGYGRNIGIEYSTADYIGFVDIDDWVEPDMYELLYEKMTEGDYDVVKGKYVQESFDGEVPVNQKPRNDRQYYFESRNGYYIHDITDFGNNGKYGLMIWNGLYKKSLIVDNNIYFPEKLTYEDIYWGSLITYYTRSEYIIDKELYHYFINPESTVTATGSEHHFDRLDVELMLLNEYKKRGIIDCDFYNIEWNFIQRFYLNSLYIFFTSYDYIPDIVNDMRKIVVQNFPDYKKNPNFSKKYMTNLVLLSVLSEPERDLDELELLILKKTYLVVLAAF